VRLESVSTEAVGAFYKFIAGRLSTYTDSTKMAFNG
jgi:hypothetical protein